MQAFHHLRTPKNRFLQSNCSFLSQFNNTSMRCAVSSCNHDSTSALSQGITFHMFPIDLSLREAWLRVINKGSWSPSEESAVCSSHFHISDLFLTEDGRCKLREGAVPKQHTQDDTNSEEIMVCDVKVCRICFATDCNLYSMKLFKNLHKAYGSLTGWSIDNEANMPPYLCSECSHQIMNCSNFKSKILQGHSTLEDILRKQDCITLESIKSCNKNQDLTKSKLSTTTTNEIYHCNVELVKSEQIDSDDTTQSSNLQRPHEHFIVEGIKKEKDDIINPESLKDEDNNMTNEIVYSPIFHKYIVPEDVKKEQEDSCNTDRHHYQDTVNYSMIHSNTLSGENYPAEVAIAVQEPEEMAIRIADSVENFAKIPLNLNQQQFDKHPQSVIETDSRLVNERLNSDANSDDTTEKPFTCYICKKSFSQKSWLTTHLRIHSGERPYLCEVCKKTFNDKSNFRKHLRIHSGEKPFPCSFCDKTFRRKNYLENHLRTHSGEKPYACGICNKVFGHKHHLKSHMRIHTGEKPYSCHICKKEFSEKSNLHMHLKVHSGERLYSCDICKIAFSTKYLLKCHSRIHTEKTTEIIKLLNRPSGNVPI